MAEDAPISLADAIRSSAERLGIDPLDLATTISYETGASFDPWKKGPTTKWGEHRGYIQWGEPQRARYGVTQDMSPADQMRAVEKYLTDAGVRPGHGLIDVYSAINAGRVGRYGASDAAAGGAPGTVADKVAGMAPHRVKAQLLLDGRLPASMTAPVGQPPQAVVPAVSAGPAPFGFAPPAEDRAGDEAIAAMLRAAFAEDERPQPAPIRINYVPLPGQRRRNRAMSGRTKG